MGAKAAIIDAEVDGKVIGHIDDDAVTYDGSRGTVVGQAGVALKEMLGRGYGRRRFHILLSAARLENCRIVSPHVVFTFESARQLEADEAPATFPEHIVDEETSNDDSIYP
jgi:hypothetical protein